MIAVLPRTVRDEEVVDSVDDDVCVEVRGLFEKAELIGESVGGVSSLIGEGFRPPKAEPGDVLCPLFEAFCCFDNSRLCTAARSLAISASFGLLTVPPLPSLPSPASIPLGVASPVL